MQTEFAFALVAAFLSVALLSASALSMVFGWTTSERRNLRKLSSGRVDPGAPAGLRLTDVPSMLEKRLRQLVPKSPKDMSRLGRSLATAGYHSTMAAALFGGAELLLPVIFGLAVAGLRGVSRGGWVFVLFAAAFGYILPGLWLSWKTAIRQKEIRNGLPDLLDLLVVCIEAGSSIDQALVKSSDELEISYPALAYEIRLVLAETRAGKPRVEAFKNFASRTKVDDVRALAAMLIQTDRFGTSVAQALRTHAESSRIKRRQRAEEKAGKIGVKLVFPLVFCLFPALWVVILGPAIIEYLRVFRGQILR